MKKHRQTSESSADGKRSRASTVIWWLAMLTFLAAVAIIGSRDMFGTGGNRIKNGVSIGPISAGGMTVEQADTEVRQFLDDYRLTYLTEEGQQVVGPLVESDIVKFDVTSAVNRAFALGRGSNALVAVSQRIGAAVFGVDVQLPYELDEDALAAEISGRFGTLISPAEDARLDIAVDNSGKYGIEVVSEKQGMSFDRAALSRETRERLREISSEPIRVRMIYEAPKVTAEELQPLKGRVGEILERAPRKVRAKGLAWTISRAQLADWIKPMREGGDVVVALDEEKVRKHLDGYGASIAIKPKDAIFKMEGERVIEFVPGVDGEKLDSDVSVRILNDIFLDTDTETDVGTVDLPVTVAKPEITTEGSNSYGITEVIGVGSTNFRGSPKNRRHNIATGAGSLNGILIPPDKEFSLLEALGPIDGEHGYLEELVIKENKTEPEFGGGLCQIGTTTFRAVMDAGLPVTERRNHSYRVSYYERDGDGKTIGPGKDATIYSPAPDFKFRNDTGSHMLLFTKVDGDRVTFTLWGKKDGRKSEQSDVTIWNQKDPPPKKEIKTTDIPAGTTKCTETPHQGASTVFTYTVTYPNGEVKEEKFYSWYKPWQEVCLIGVTQAELDAEAAAAAAGTATGESGMQEVAPGEEEG